MFFFIFVYCYYWLKNICVQKNSQLAWLLNFIFLGFIKKKRLFVTFLGSQLTNKIFFIFLCIINVNKRLLWKKNFFVKKIKKNWKIEKLSFFGISTDVQDEVDIFNFSKLTVWLIFRWASRKNAQKKLNRKSIF